MTHWSPENLKTFGGAEEIQIASYRNDGTLRPFVTIWIVRSNADLFVRSAHGPGNPWFRNALRSGRGRIRGGGSVCEVAFETCADSDHAAIDAAYHTKYDRYGQRIVGTVVGAQVAPTTLRLRPRAD